MSNSNTVKDVGTYSDSVKRRFEMKFVKGKPNECWEWLASRNNAGYGKMAIDNKGKLEYSHRLSYQMYKGEIPQGLVVMHSCDNKGCVNPNHLSVGTHKDNIGSAARNGLMNKRPRLYGEKNGAAKYTDEQILQVIELLKQGLRQKDISEMTGISPGHVSKISLGKVRVPKQRSENGKAFTFATHSQGVGDSRKTITPELQQQIVDLSGQGLSQYEVADELGISQCTVSTYLSKLRKG